VGRGKCRHRDRYPIGKDHHGKGRGQAKERRHMRPELEYPDSTKQPDHRNGGDGGGYGHATERVIYLRPHTTPPRLRPPLAW
jgi:hypothetical protein